MSSTVNSYGHVGTVSYMCFLGEDIGKNMPVHIPP